MGEIMKQMSQSMQFHITHLPTFSKRDAHFKVFKSTIDDDTQSELKLLNNDERVVEIAQNRTAVTDSALIMQKPCWIQFFSLYLFVF
jgi:DNA repair protein RecN (Recombination protein N)